MRLIQNICKSCPAAYWLDSSLHVLVQQCGGLCATCFVNYDGIPATSFVLRRAWHFVKGRLMKPQESLQ